MSPTVPLHRRQVLSLVVGAAGAAIAGSGTAQGQSQNVVDAALQTIGDGQPFDVGHLTDVARLLAKRAYVTPANDLPDAFAKLNYDQYVGIRARPENTIWNADGRGFAIEPLHRGFLFTNKVLLFTVEDGRVKRIAYDRSNFDFGKLQPPEIRDDIGFSGFRVYAEFGGSPLQEAAIFQGASFFRAIAKGQNFGIHARSLILKAAEARGEEFPFFRAFWIERPTAGSGALVVHGLLDSESIAGVVRFTLRPGDLTITDLEASLFPRVALDHVGWGGMTASYLFGPNDQSSVADVRPAVYEVKGLSILNGHGEWIWRPVSNPETLQISAFVDTNPRGFGLLQRDRDFATFQDDDQHFELRPSLWAEPLGDWGPGSVQLIEIPSDSEVNDNIIAYWRPQQPLPAGGEASFALRLYWCWTPPERPKLAAVANTRVGRGPADKQRRFAVDFVGDALADPATAQQVKATITAAPGKIANLRLWSYPNRKSLRVVFDLDPGNETSCELRLVLQAGEKHLSETWLYRWTA